MAITKRESIWRLAKAAGFGLAAEDNDSMALFHSGRQEGVNMHFTLDGKLSSATWHAPDRWAVVTDRRANPERSVRDDAWLTGTDKRLPAGVSSLHWAQVAARRGMDVKEREIRRRIKDPGWAAS